MQIEFKLTCRRVFVCTGRWILGSLALLQTGLCDTQLLMIACGQRIEVTGKLGTREGLRTVDLRHHHLGNLTVVISVRESDIVVYISEYTGMSSGLSHHPRGVDRTVGVS